MQGTLYSDLRKLSAEELTKRNARGFAIGGLRYTIKSVKIYLDALLFGSGGESKDEFWRVVHLCTDILPKDKPRYLMGVGFAMDLVVCCALGVDMFDCVFPTRTAVSCLSVILN